MKIEELRDVIAEVLHCAPGAVTPEARLREDLGADSLNAVELVMALEEYYGVFADDGRLPGLRTISDVIDYWKELTEH